MATTNKRFVPVEVENEDIQEETQSEDTGAAMKIMMLALKSLSQKALVALSSLFSAAAVASAWALWYGVLREPTVLQLVGCGMYACFILAVEIVRRRT